MERESVFTYNIVNANSHVKQIFRSDLVMWASGETTCAGGGALAAGDSFAVDLPDRSVLFEQVDVAEGPDVHYALNETEEQRC